MLNTLKEAAKVVALIVLVLRVISLSHLLLQSLTLRILNSRPDLNGGPICASVIGIEYLGDWDF